MVSFGCIKSSPPRVLLPFTSCQNCQTPALDRRVCSAFIEVPAYVNDGERERKRINEGVKNKKKNENELLMEIEKSFKAEPEGT